MQYVYSTYAIRINGGSAVLQVVVTKGVTKLLMSTVLNSTVLNKKFCFTTSDETLGKIAESAADREISASAWIRQAVFAYLRTAQKNKLNYESKAKLWPSGYPKSVKCPLCKECHDGDPVDFHYDGAWELGDEDFEYAEKHANSCRG